ADGPPVKPYAKETLTALRKMGLSVAVATSSRAEIALPYLEKTGLLPLLDTAVTGERVERGKPFPDIFLLAARELGLPAKACAVVEDAKNGILAAHRAGCYPILVPDLYPPAEEILPLLWHRAGSLWEIPALVRAHNEGRA
ncbi:MAG: HAD-IA family hydrolase, partial [Clostridia bacterium]|nr:HAD-IA family hydrolase [Clostridia bacterium]